VAALAILPGRVGVVCAKRQGVVSLLQSLFLRVKVINTCLSMATGEHVCCGIMFFPRDAVLVVDAENLPCTGPGEAIQQHYLFYH